MKTLHTLAFILLVVGGLNWGLEVFNVGIASFLPPSLTTIIYALVGLSALFEISTHKSNCRCCDGSCDTKSPM